MKRPPLICICVSYLFVFLGLCSPQTLAQNGNPSNDWVVLPDTGSVIHNYPTDDGRTFTYQTHRVVHKVTGEQANLVSVMRSNYPGEWKRRVITDKNMAELLPDSMGKGFFSWVSNWVKKLKKTIDKLVKMVKKGAEALKELANLASGLADRIFAAAEAIDVDFAGLYALAAQKTRALPPTAPPNKRLMKAIDFTIKSDPTGRATRQWGAAILSYKSE